MTPKPLVAGIAVVVGLACGRLVQDDLYSAHPEQPFTQIHPPPRWEVEYRWTWENCGKLASKTGIPRRLFRSLNFYVVEPGTNTTSEAFTVHIDGFVYEALGFWSEDNIYLTKWATIPIAHPWVRVHEYLHAQLGRGHGPIYEFCRDRVLSLGIP